MNVLDCWSVFGEAGISDEKMIYVAAMAAQLLDNNEDGSVDDPDLEMAMLQHDGQIRVSWLRPNF